MGADPWHPISWRVGSPSAYAVNSVTLRTLFLSLHFTLCICMHAHVQLCEGQRKITGLCTMWVQGIKLRSSGLAASTEPLSALGGTLSGKSPGFSWGWIFFNRSVRLRSSGSTPDRNRAASPEGECSVVTLETQTEQTIYGTAAPGTPSISGATIFPHSHNIRWPDSQDLFRSRPLRAVATGYGFPTLPTSALTHPSRDFGGAAMARP